MTLMTSEEFVTELVMLCKSNKPLAVIVVEGDSDKKLFEQLFHSLLGLRDIRIEFGIGSLKVSIGDHRRAAMSGSGDVYHVEIVLPDDSVQMHIDEIKTGRRAPMPQQSRLDIIDRQGPLQEWIVIKIDLSD